MNSGKTDGYFGAKKGNSFPPYRVEPYYLACYARAYRLAADMETKQQYWGVLRSMFKGAGLGDIGEDRKAKPAFNFKTKTPEQAYVYALVDLYRETRNPKMLKFMEHIERNIIKRRQDPKTGLFALEADRETSVRIHSLKKDIERHEGTTVREMLRDVPSIIVNTMPLIIVSGLIQSLVAKHIAGETLERKT